MITELIKLVFEQAKNETPNITKTGLSKHISKKIEENNKSKIFSYKTFTRYYDKYIIEKEGVIDQPQTEIIEELCKYIGYDNYQDFVSKNNPKANNLISVIQKENLIDQSITFKTNRKLITKIGNTFISNKALIILIIFMTLFMSYFNSNWDSVNQDFSFKEYYKNSERQEFINEKGVFENTRNTFIDSSVVFKKNKIGVLAYEEKE